MGVEGLRKSKSIVSNIKVFVSCKYSRNGTRSKECPKIMVFFSLLLLNLTAYYFYTFVSLVFSQHLPWLEDMFHLLLLLLPTV